MGIVVYAIALANPAWEYCGVYADEDYTGTKASRPEFQRLLADCRAGRIDIVVQFIKAPLDKLWHIPTRMFICKSNTRLARNTVTLLETVRELRSLHVDCFFEEEDIRTESKDGEMLLTILASLAQAESLSVSENCKWKIRNGFRDGKPTPICMYGYKMIQGRFIVIPEEAEVVRTIFALFLSGLGKNAMPVQKNANTNNIGR